MLIYITPETTRDELLSIWDQNIELVDAFIEAGVDPDLPETPTSVIYDVIVAWIEAGDECASS